MKLDRGMPPDKITRYFTVDPKGHKIRDDIRALATFRQLNLLGPLAFPHRFDIVMCRNVTIYFTEQDNIRLFKGIERVLAPDGYLMIGSTETITGLCRSSRPSATCGRCTTSSRATHSKGPRPKTRPSQSSMRATDACHYPSP